MRSEEDICKLLHVTLDRLDFLNSFRLLTILILEKLTRPSSVKLGVPSSIKARSVRYIPKYGTQGGLQLNGKCKDPSFYETI